MKKRNIIIIAISLVIIVAIIAIITQIFISNKNNKLKTVVTADNINEIVNSFSEEEEDKLCYYIYAYMTYMAEDSFNEDTMYDKIYGKTVEELVNEGKVLMIANGLTIEDYKEQLELWTN